MQLPDCLLSREQAILPQRVIKMVQDETCWKTEDGQNKRSIMGKQNKMSQSKFKKKKKKKLFTLAVKYRKLMKFKFVFQNYNDKQTEENVNDAYQCKNRLYIASTS